MPKLSRSQDGGGGSGGLTSVLVRRTLRQRTKAARAPVARTHRSATATDQQGRGDEKVAVGMCSGRREGKSGPILVVAGVGMSSKQAMW